MHSTQRQLHMGRSIRAVASVLDAWGFPRSVFRVLRFGGDPGAAFSEPAVAELARAVGRGDVPRIRRLVGSGVDVDARGDDHVNLLEWALLGGSRTGFSALLEVGADPVMTLTESPQFRSAKLATW